MFASRALLELSPGNVMLSKFAEMVVETRVLPAAVSQAGSNSRMR